jgi:hypothetical protein
MSTEIHWLVGPWPGKLALAARPARGRPADDGQVPPSDEKPGEVLDEVHRQLPSDGMFWRIADKE